jgi:adenylyl cyclase-associated protein
MLETTLIEPGVLYTTHVMTMERPITVPESRLTMIYRRLEAATSRLEDMATSVDSSHPSTVAAISSSAVALPGSSTTAAAAAAPSPDPLPPSIADFDKILEQDVKAFVNASEKIGGLVEQQAWL